MKQFNKTVFLGLFALFLCSSVFAEDIELEGKVLDGNGVPIGGVEVELESLGLIDTTDSQGKWSIVKSQANISSSSISRGFTYTLQNQYLSFHCEKTEQLKLAVYSINGVQKFSHHNRYSAGRHQIDLSGLSDGAYYIDLTTAKTNDRFRMEVFKNSLRVVETVKTNSKKSASKKAYVDRLRYRLQGYILTEDEIQSARGYIEKYLLIRNVSGRFNPDPFERTEIDSVFASFTGGRMPKGAVVKIGWSKQTNSYTGKIYTVKPHVGFEYEYQIHVYGVDSNSNKTTQSIHLDFDDNFGDLEMPGEYAGNLLPMGKIVDTNGNIASKVLVQNELPLVASFVDDSLNKNLKYEWDLGDGSFVIGDSTVLLKKESVGSYTIRVRVTDDDDNQVVDSCLISVIPDSVSYSDFKDTTITISDYLSWQFSAEDVDTIKKVIFDFGDDSKQVFFNNSRTIDLDVTHQYPGSDLIPLGTQKDFELNISIVDLKNQVNTQKYLITVVNDEPFVGDIELITNNYSRHMKMGDSIIVKMDSISDAGEYRVDISYLDGAVLASSADADIKLPFIGEEDSLVVVKVIDDDSNAFQDTLLFVQNGYYTDERDGRVYHWKRIGGQIWMTQNLNYKLDQSELGLDTCYSGATECNEFGRLYNWQAALQVQSSVLDRDYGMHQGVCPEGWMLPSRRHWDILFEHIDSVSTEEPAVNSLKAPGYWESDEFKNEFGFSALPGGVFANGFSYFQDSLGKWWSSSFSFGENANLVEISKNGIDRDFQDAGQINDMISIRCLSLIRDTIFMEPVDLIQKLGDTLRFSATIIESGRSWGLGSYSWVVDGQEMSAETQNTDLIIDSLGFGKHEIVAKGTFKSNEISDTIHVIIVDEFTDSRDNKNYDFVKVGDLYWMAENLNFDSGSDAECYAGEVSNCEKYGRLYGWITGMQIDSQYISTSWDGNENAHQGICPDGWRIPSEQDWSNMNTALGGGDGRPSITNPIIKAEEWGGTNDFGFSALPAGAIRFNGSTSLGTSSYWMSSTQKNVSDVYTSIRGVGQEYNLSDNYSKSEFKVSVRCVKNVD